jgi:hypothetical protein
MNSDILPHLIAILSNLYMVSFFTFFLYLCFALTFSVFNSPSFLLFICFSIFLTRFLYFSHSKVLTVLIFKVTYVIKCHIFGKKSYHNTAVSIDISSPSNLEPRSIEISRVTGYFSEKSPRKPINE